MADALTGKVQQALKDQGFYYGEVTGKMDADTSAAIRRYQIRNGLKINGELDAETQKSLGIAGERAPAATPQPTQAPAQPPDTSDLRDDSAAGSVTPASPAPAPPPTEPVAPPVSDVFAGTPYETAPPDVQQRIVIGAQTTLARSGYYRSGIDGVFGPGTEFALRAYQSRIGLPATGRLDMETLSALRLLPGPSRAGFPPMRRFMRPPPREFTPYGEPIYRPN